MDKLTLPEKEERLLAPISEMDARFKNPLVLAFLGDTVYDLYIRSTIVKNTGACINTVHRAAVGQVNAHAQAMAAEMLEPLFTEAEQDIYRRGRNAKSGVPKNMSVIDYRRATGLEAVIGYLYLTGQYARLEELFERIINGREERNE